MMTCLLGKKCPSKSLLGRILLILLLSLTGEDRIALTAEPFTLHLDERPFSPGLCKTSGTHKPIRIRIKDHRDLIISRVPGQYVPSDANTARTKDYIYFVKMEDLTDGIVEAGGIAFNRDHAVIFNSDHPKGLARKEFLESIPEPRRIEAERGLDTFLRLHPVLKAAIDTCRPYPPFVTYGTDDEIDRIEAGRHTFAKRVRAFNEDPRFLPLEEIPEPGLSDGFVDPGAGDRKNVSYQALNPLNFYVP